MKPAWSHLFVFSLHIGFFLLITAPFYLSDNTDRHYLDFDDLRDPATIINGYRRLLSHTTQTTGQTEPVSTLRRWTDERGIVNYSDSKNAPKHSEVVDLGKIKNTNFIAMDGYGSIGKAILVYGILVVVMILLLRYLWLTMKQAGQVAISAASRPDPRSYTAIEHKPGGNTHHAILGIAESASDEEIKRAYRQKMSQFHPDKVANMSDKVREHAVQQAQLVNAAYKALGKQG